AKRCALVAAHRAYAAGVYVLDDREGLAAIGFTPVDLAVEGQCEAAAQRNVMLMLGVQHVVLQANGGEVSRQAGIAALVGRQGAVSGVFGPTQVEDDRIGGAAVFVHVVLISLGRVVQVERVALEADPGEDSVVLRDGNAEVKARAQRRHAVVAFVLAVGPRFVRRGAAIVQRGGLADAVLGPVGVGVGNDRRTVGFAGVDLQRQAVAAAEDVVLADAGRQNHLVGRAVAHPQVDHAGGLFFDVYIDVDLVGRAGHGLGVHIDLVEVAQAVDAIARHLDVVGVVPRGFHLAHFAADDLVPGTGVAADLDAAHVHAPARIDIERQVGLVRVAVEDGIGIDVGEGIAQAAQVIG